MPIGQLASFANPKFSPISGHPGNAKSTGSFLDFMQSIEETGIFAGSESK